MKRFFSVFLMMVLLLSLLCGCGSKTSEGLTFSEGLIFSTRGDGTCVWTGIGSCVDTEIIVPETFGDQQVVAVSRTAGSEDNNMIKKIVLPDTVKEIAPGAFENMHALQTLDMGDGVEIIGESAVAHCKNLSQVVWSKALKTIEAYAFAGATSLTAIALPDSVEEIGFGAFSGIPNLKKLTLPAALKEFNLNMFDTSALEELNFTGDFSHYAVTYSFATERPADHILLSKEFSGARYEGALTKEDIGSLLCAMMGKATLNYNGEEITAQTQPEIGRYSSEGMLYDVEVTENQTIKLHFSQIANRTIEGELPYTYDEQLHHYRAEGVLTDLGQSGDLSVIFIPVGDQIYLAADGSFASLMQGVWSK